MPRVGFPENVLFTHRSFSQGQLNSIEFIARCPTLGNETFPCHVVVEHVHRVIDGLDLRHFHLPDTKISRRGRKNPLTMILCLMKNDVQIFQSCHHTHGQFKTFRRILWARIDCGSETKHGAHSRSTMEEIATTNEPFTNLLRAILQLFTLEEDDEDRLADVFSLETKQRQCSSRKCV